VALEVRQAQLHRVEARRQSKSSCPPSAARKAEFIGQETVPCSSWTRLQFGLAVDRAERGLFSLPLKTVAAEGVVLHDFCFAARE
jgi:hypothetical protein